MTDPALTIELRSQTPRRVAMTMRWRDLLFLHYPCEPGSIQRLLPPGLTVDTFPDASGIERAWVGLVPFRMEGVHPRGLPRIRSCEDFPETNVRTYCHVEGRDPGVWFFSLDAANPFACRAARRWFHLNYLEAAMTVSRNGDEVAYQSRRLRGAVESAVRCQVGPEIGMAEPGSLEFFLVERYLLYSAGRRGLGQGRVYHAPYSLKRVEGFEASAGLMEANGLEARPFVHAMFSEGIDVVGSGLTRL